MNSFRVFRRQVRRGAAALGILGVVSLLSLAPAMVASATNTITTRSIALSSSAAAATGVSYNVNFTTSSSDTSSTAAFVLEFCADSPAVGTSCEAPAGFNASSATTPAGNTVSALTQAENNGLVITLGTAAAAGATVTVPLNGISNPTAAGSLYARIITYSTAAAAETYQSATPGSYLDDGSVALSINNSVNVKGEVLESLVFCASGSALSSSCGTSTILAPDLKLGDSNGVLSTDAVSSTGTGTGTVYTMISTNANSGAVVSMKSNALGCGGLINSSAPTKCYIKPAGTTPLSSIALGAAQFGMELSGITNGSGTGTLAANAPYATTGYVMDWVTGDTTGVTSPYGSPIYNTSGAPISNATANLVFGANAGNETPSGSYSANLNLIATGTF